ncbi:MAG: VWA domain-containing protein [Bradymonadales bacterium]|nr:VWA domain-containing protein [Bradymonadales bacterium]
MKRLAKITLFIYAALAVPLVLLWFWNPPFFRPVKGAVKGTAEFVFDYPWLLLLALLVVPLLLLGFTQVKRKQVGAMVYTRGDLVRRAPRSWRVWLRPVPVGLRGLGVLALVLAVARPQVTTEQMQLVEGIDIYLILDMSGSMQAIDLTLGEVEALRMRNLVPMNRFEIAKTVLSEFVERRRERPWYDRIGMVIFARHAFLQFPLTIDYNTVLWLVDRLELNDIDASQTAIGNALGRAISGLIESPATSRIIILITDGDERGGNISAVEAARVAADEGIQIYPILVGREGPVLVPAERTHFGFGQRYIQHEYPVDPELLEQIAQTSGGRFFRAENREELEGTLEEIIAEYEKTQMEDLIRQDREEAYFPFVLAGFLLIGLDLLLRFTLLRKFP